MQKLTRNSVIVMICSLAVAFCLCPLYVRAEEEWVSFGSESYEWELETVSPIGIYANSVTGVHGAEMYVKYDPEMLEHLENGESVEPGLIKIVANPAGELEYGEMLQFSPKIAGTTEITIQDAVIDSGSSAVSQVVSASVEVNIPIPAGCELNDIKLNMQELEGFNSSITKYHMDVTADIERLELEVFPADERAQFEISDTNLYPGENWIQILVTNEQGQQSRYQLIVNRAEQEVVAIEEETNMEEETSTEEKADAGEDMPMDKASVQKEPSGVMEGRFVAAVKSQVLIIVVLAILVFVLCLLIVAKLKLSKSRYRKKKRQLKSGSDQAIAAGRENAGGDVKNGENGRRKRKPLAILVSGVTMDFEREKDESGSIKELMIRTIKRQRHVDTFRALNDVSFKVRPGEVIGIIGTNGSGKSTLLKIISGALIPTEGKVRINRSKVQLLTLGTGFDLELTGKENVYLNGAIIGYTREYINEKYDQIVAFAELEGFMEEKVKNYSSGMVSRLAFAIATVRDSPEILILDEVLSVGDMFFRKKSEQRIKEMIHGGSTVLIVSHSSSVIRDNCTKAIWIDKGVLKAVGDPNEVCASYEGMYK